MKTAIARHILVKDKELAEQLKKKINDGADFSKIAKQHSTCNSAKRGGELGEIKKGDLVAAMDKAVFTLKTNQLHGPIKTKFGWHLLEIKFRMEF